jgi:YidC/Oxa1 family membrane protein insertase
VLATIWSAQISKKQMESNNSGANEQAQSMSNSMMTIMPIMTAFFTYTMPIGMSLYWFVSTLAQIIQQTVITKMINKSIENNTPSERKDKK